MFHRNRRGLSSYVNNGDRLLAKMLAQGAPPAKFTGFTRELLRRVAENGCGDAADYYIWFVSQAVVDYWPDTPLRGLKQCASIVKARLSSSSPRLQA